MRPTRPASRRSRSSRRSRQPGRAAPDRRVRRHSRGDQGRIARLEQDRATLPDPDRVARALGVLYARNQDVRAPRPSSRRRSPPSRLARGALALARLHLGKSSTRREGVQGGGGSGARGVVRASAARGFYLLTRRVDDAVKVLTDITNQAPDAFPAWLRRAEIAFAQGKLKRRRPRSPPC